MLDTLQNQEFVRLWTLHGRCVYAYLTVLIPNRADVDEIYQEVGITLWEKFDQFDPDTSFQAWARAVALNKVRNFRQLRRHNTLLCSTEFLDAVDQMIAERAGTLDAQGKALADCFNKLPAKHKDLIERRYRAGATPQVIAAQLGRSLTAVYKSLARIHDALFECVHKATVGEEAR